MDGNGVVAAVWDLVVDLKEVGLVLLGSVLTLLTTVLVGRHEARRSDERDARTVRAPLYDEAINLTDEMLAHLMTFGSATGGNGMTTGQTAEEFAHRDGISAAALDDMMSARVNASKIVSRMRAHGTEDAARQYLEILAIFDQYTDQLQQQITGDGVFRSQVFNEYVGRLSAANEHLALSVRQELWSNVPSMKLKKSLPEPTQPFPANDTDTSVQHADEQTRP